MNLGDLITALETADQNLVVANGFTNPHSYRGEYMDLAFEPTPTVPVTAMLVAARSALNAIYTGYKGGEFLMTANTWCWLSLYGDASCETLSPLALKAMLTQAAAPAHPDPARALAAEIHRRLGRLQELRAADRNKTAQSNIHGETVGLRAALGILLGAPAASGGEDVARGDAYYQHWLNQQTGQD